MITQMKNAVVAALWRRRTVAQASELRPEAHAARVEAPEDRRAHGLGQRNAEARRTDDRHRLEHRRRARTEAEPGAATLGHPRERNTAGQGDPEAASGRGSRGEERDHGHVGRSGRGARSHGGHDRSGDGEPSPPEVVGWSGLPGRGLGGGWV